MSTSNNAVRSADLNCVIGKNVKINKYVLVGVNTAFLLPFVIKNYSIAGLIAFLAVTLILAYTAFKSSDQLPAVANLPLIFLGDALVWIAVRIIGEGHELHPEYLGQLLSETNTMFWILFLAGGVLGFFGFTRKKIQWLTGFAGCLIGASIILLGWSNSDLEDLVFFRYGAAIMILFLIASLLWTVLLYIIVKTAPSKAKISVWIGVVLLVLTILLLTIGVQYVAEHSGKLAEWILLTPSETFAWWKVILASVVLLGAAFTLYVMNGELSVDAYALVIAGELTLGTKLLMSNYFTHNAVLLVILVVGTLKCMKNHYSGRKTMRLDSDVYLPAQFCAVVLALILLKNGLWINLIVSIVFLTAIFVYSGRTKKKINPMTQWTLILLCIVLEAAAWVWAKSFILEKMILLAVVLVMGLFALYYVTQKRPDGHTGSVKYRIVICVCAALICLAAMTRFGVTIREEYDAEKNTATIELEARGSEGSVRSASYYWRDTLGEAQSDDVEIKGRGCRIRVNEEILTVVAEDDRGVVSKKVFWYPNWVSEWFRD